MAHFVDPFTHNLYVFGGQDLKEGLCSSLWRISLSAVRDNMSSAKWEQFRAKNDPPCASSHLTGFIFAGKLFLFGGSVQERNDPRDADPMRAFPPQPVLIEIGSKAGQLRVDDPPKPLMFHVLNLASLTWSEWRKARFPKYDDFASYFYQKTGVMYVFGGFRNGSRSNELMGIDVGLKLTAILSADCADPTKDKVRPSQRAGSRMACLEDEMKLFLFGGLDS